MFKLFKTDKYKPVCCITFLVEYFNSLKRDMIYYTLYETKKGKRKVKITKTKDKLRPKERFIYVVLIAPWLKNEMSIREVIEETNKINQCEVIPYGDHR